MIVPLSRTAALAAALLATTGLARAQERDTRARAPDDDIVVVAQERNATDIERGGQLGVLGDKSAADVPFSIRSYSDTIVLNQQPQTLGELLQNDPTIRTSFGFGNAAELFVIRGFEAGGDDLSLEGLYGIAPRQLVSPELFSSIQVLNGASAFLNGAAPSGGALGGNINLLFKRAQEDPITRVTGNYYADSNFGGSADIGRRFGDGRFGVRVNGAYRAGDVAIDGEFRRNAVVGGAFDYDGGDVRLSLDVAYQRVQVKRLRHKVTLATTTVPRVPGAHANYAQDFTYTTLRDIYGTLKAEWDVAPNATLYAVAGARDGSERGIYGGITVTDAATGAARNPGGLFVPADTNNEAATAGLRVRLADGGITHEINVGGNVVRQVFRTAYDFRYTPDFTGLPNNLYAPVQQPLPASVLVGGDLDDPYPINRTRLGSAFASDTIGLFGDRVLVTGGLRLQALNQRTYSYFGGAQTQEVRASAVTPVAGLVVKPVAGLSLFANRIEALQPGQVAGAGTVNAGEVFDPYRTVQYEVGGKIGLGRLNASIAAFTAKTPLAFAELIPGSTTLSIFGVFGRRRTQGIELTVDGEVAPGLRVIAGGTYIDAELRETANGQFDGNRAQGVPEWLANANVEWDLPFVRGLTLTGRVNYTGDQAANAANTLIVDDWTRFDLGARFVAAVGATALTFRVNVDNVANKRHWASAFDNFSSALLQGLPRTVKASVTAEF